MTEGKIGLWSIPNTDAKFSVSMLTTIVEVRGSALVDYRKCYTKLKKLEHGHF